MIDQGKVEEELRKALGKGPKWYEKGSRFNKAMPFTALAVWSLVIIVSFATGDEVFGSFLLFSASIIGSIVLGKKIYKRHRK